jgi:hypothetical protein
MVICCWKHARENGSHGGYKNAEQMGGTVWTMNQFSWENKYVGVQIKATKVQFSQTSFLPKSQQGLIQIPNQHVLPPNFTGIPSTIIPRLVCGKCSFFWMGELDHMHPYLSSIQRPNTLSLLPGSCWALLLLS